MGTEWDLVRTFNYEQHGHPVSSPTGLLHFGDYLGRNSVAGRLGVQTIRIRLAVGVDAVYQRDPLLLLQALAAEISS